MTIKRKIISILIIVAGYLILRNSSLLPIEASNSNLRTEEQGIVTELLTVAKVQMVQDLTYLGTLESDTKAMLSPKVTGNVTDINVSEGDIVYEGEILLQIDSEQLEAKLKTVEQRRNLLYETLSYLDSELGGFYSTNPLGSKLQSARLSLDFQESEVDKLRTLYEAGAVSKSQLDQGEHQLQSLRLQVKELEQTMNSNYNKLQQERDVTAAQLGELEASIDEMALSLRDSSIKAPFDGQITQIIASVGELASPGRALVSLDNVHQLRVVTQVGETDLQRIRRGMEVEVTLSGHDDPIGGTISFKSGSVNPNTRIGEVRVDVELPAEEVVIGSSARIRILLDSSRNEIMIPSSSVKTLETGMVVYVYNGKGRVYERKITIGNSVGGQYQVIEGLAEGDVIAVRNIQSLSDGSLVYKLEEEITR
ncbi:efflux RND transporter periplasmic adaptor subunit [Gudongella sp. SC589]|jgi:multidrug resistance efflux pump|uniref:efflux RND transporter periplasmic adaptor subunit n=1 Tax=Gudongella sp. SC589 TaxID=3385990 RepID=UPI003904A173